MLNFKSIKEPIIIGTLFASCLLIALYVGNNFNLNSPVTLGILIIDLLVELILIGYLYWRTTRPATNQLPSKPNQAQDLNVHPTLFHQNNLDQPTKPIRK